MSERREDERPEPGSAEWYALHWPRGAEPGSVREHHDQWDLMNEMLETVQGMPIDPRTEEGRGELVDIDPGQFSIHPCEWNDARIPVMMYGIGGEARPMYFARAYAFHPGTEPTPTTKNAPGQLSPPRGGRAVVVDTGWRKDQHQHPNYDAAHVDPCEIDVPHGHGPAIVDLMQDLAPRAELQLRQVAFENTPFKDPLGNPCIPIFTHPDGGALFRGFAESSLVETLKNLAVEIAAVAAKPRERIDVVNISLGAVACPEMMAKHDPVGEEVRKIAQNAKVVVAAGNHGVDTPSWPAAYATGVGAVKSIANVISVGSGPDENLRSSFSAHGTWVQKWRDGLNVPVRHPNTAEYGTDVPNVAWSGTSFAAPIYAAELLPKVGESEVDDIDDPRVLGQVPIDGQVGGSMDVDISRVPISDPAAVRDVPNFLQKGDAPE